MLGVGDTSAPLMMLYLDRENRLAIHVLMNFEKLYDT